MRWTDENKNILWCTIFETQNLHIDLDVISRSWPGEENPTPKALKEHLSKYRKNLKGANTVTFSMSSGNKRGAGGDDTPTGTPRKKRASKKVKVEGDGREEGSGISDVVEQPVTPKRAGEA